MALVNCMETYFKHTTPDITLISEENFKINVHKEMFYQTQLMRTMIKSTDSDYCCSKVSVICSIPKEELKLIVQFLYSGKLFFKNQKELSQLSENLTGLFGFPKIIEPKIEPTSNSISKEELSFDLKKSSNRKESRKQSLTSALVRDDFIEELVPVKIESENLADETNLNDDNLSDPLDTNVKGGDAESEMVCNICNKKFISKNACLVHVFRKHKDACNICLKQFESKNTWKLI